MLQYRWSKRILTDVRSRVSGGKRDGNYEVRRHKAEQDEYEELPLPTRELVLEHRDRTFTVRTLFSNAVVDRQRTEERQHYKDERCDRRKRLGGEKSDAGLIT